MIWKQTFTGRAVDMLAPLATDIDFADIAHALALINRYDGHTRQPISVAQHCVMGADAMLHETGSARLAALFLLHDAHEAYVGDTGTPVQQALAALCPDALDALRELRRRFDVAIHVAAGVASPDCQEHLALKRMDVRMLRAERDALMPAKPQDWHHDVEMTPPIPGMPSFASWPAGWRYAELRYAERVRDWLMPSLGRAA